MDIIGRGMVARSFLPHQAQFPDVVIFATGVANSQLPSVDDYRSEYDQLCETLQRCAAENKRLVYFSSAGAVYGASNEVKDEATPTFPTSAYGRHKLLCEAVIQHSGARHLIIRLANLVGGSQNRHQLIPALCEQILRGDIALYQRATRDILDVADFVDILLCLLSQHHEDDLLLVTTGHSIPVVELCSTLQRLLDREVRPQLIDRGDEQRFSTEKLRSLIPSAVFSPGYYRDVLSRYVHEYLK